MPRFHLIMQRNHVQAKVVLLGDSGVGKSSLVLRFVADSFKADGEATIGASFMGKVLQFVDKSVKFNIWDTAGQERYHTLARMYYRDANAAILVYDITVPESFQGLRRWHEQLVEHGPKDIIKVIAANKDDLIDKEAVPIEEVKEFAKQVGAIFRKTSAKTNYGVEQIFREIAVQYAPELSSAARDGKESRGVRLEHAKSGSAQKKGCC